MAAPIEFFFDFASPYSYIAATQIEALAARHGRTVAFKPMLLGAAFKVSGMAPLTEIPLKGDYSRRDFERTARFLGVPFRMPSVFPLGTVNTARAMLWLQQNDPTRATPFMFGALRAYFTEDRNINDTAVIAQIAADVGADGAKLLAGIQEPALKDRLKAHVEGAIARGVFGAPYVFVDGEPFWGNDRLPQIERWLAQGPF
jgi:2-hydroxychromene-2-carboxylate isomerase